MTTHRTGPRSPRTAADVEAAEKSLAEAIHRLSVRNDELKAYLDGKGSDPIERVANAPDVDLPDATERARKYWDKLEGRRSTVPPPKGSA